MANEGIFIIIIIIIITRRILYVSSGLPENMKIWARKYEIWARQTVFSRNFSDIKNRRAAPCSQNVEKTEGKMVRPDE